MTSKDLLVIEYIRERHPYRHSVADISDWDMDNGAGSLSYSYRQKEILPNGGVYWKRLYAVVFKHAFMEYVSEIRDKKINEIIND